ncbi:uncharacterized protein K441DRAFT_673645 [Cenococcum geophilum 1.58]|uniref:uncharacterized protein n=1 Tax=Cenococcum geophilum 1.58 TaxID=794803 RepID=UPI00358EB14C|nr:hypothetical protein K441DRAFT_673645 [Cenococcum geophilum 1.58]
MATANGTLTPPSLNSSTSSTSITKRKRSHSSTELQANGATSEPADEPAKSPDKDLQHLLEDILAVLRSHDTQPSILNLPINTLTNRSPAGEPSAKRTKLAQHEEPTTIASRIQDGSYSSLEALVEDVDTASTDILSSIKSNENLANGSTNRYSQSSLEDTQLVTGALALQKALKNIVTRETQRISRSSNHVTEQIEDGIDDVKPTNGATGAKQDHTMADEIQDSRTVLTLYGSAQGPKQLFSSLQQPFRVPSSNDSGTPTELDASIKITLPLRESSLPNIISTTKIVPIYEEDAMNGKDTGPTFGELFAPPANMPHLSPPKPAKQLTTRGTTISFVPQDLIPKASRKGTYMYPTQNLSTGQWLGYSGVDLPKEPSSPTAKQKNRQRALSTGEAHPAPSEAALAALQQAKEDALFRSAYSSFAPSRDDATAIVPEQTKNRVWWQKVGEKRFEEAFAIDPALLDSEKATTVNGASTLDEEEGFKEAVENFTPPENGFTTKSSTNSGLDKDTNEILKEISDMLETLASHQRIRNSSLATNSRTPVIQNASLVSLVGSPSSPSTAEIDTYNILKSQLSLMISSLPPFAIAKLNGEQLAELNISRNLLIETKDYRGVLEEDQVSRLAKAAALSAAVGSTPGVRMGSGPVGTHSHFPPSSNQYPRATPASHAPVSRSTQGPQSYYPQQQAPHRSPSVHYQRSSTSSTQPYQTPGNYGNSTPRTSYPATQAFGQQTSRSSYSQNNSGQFYHQRSGQPGNYGIGGSQYYQSTPQTQSQNRYQQPQANYQQRPQNVAPMYNNYGSSQSPHMRTVSPLKAGQQPNQPTQTPYAASRSSYGTPTANTQARGGSYFNQPVSQSAAQYGTPQPATPSALGPSGFHTSMTTEQQQLMMDRQRAQLAMQPQARMAAQGNANRRDSGTPQPPNGQYGGQQQVNGTPMVA